MGRKFVCALVNNLTIGQLPNLPLIAKVDFMKFLCETTLLKSLKCKSSKNI